MKRLYPLFISFILSVIAITAGIFISQNYLASSDLTNLVISEFMASNQNTIFDEDGDASDWIEIFNPTQSKINLKGYAITENRRNDPWVFPDLVLPPNEKLVVWASGKDRAETNKELLILRGGGRDIWDVSDSFYYDFVRVEPGNFSIIARVRSIEHTHAWAKSGVMVRTGLDESSAHASMFATPANGFAFQRRTLQGLTTQHSPVNTHLVFPNAWVKLTVQKGVPENIITVEAFASADGLNWISAGSIPLRVFNNEIFVGLALTSQNPGNLSEAKFSDLSITNYSNWRESAEQLNIGTSDRGSSTVESYNVLHTNFRLRESGELLSLLNPQGELIDGLTFSEQTVDHSYGRTLNFDSWAYFANPTPGERNRSPAKAGVTGVPRFNVTSGTFEDAIDLEIYAMEGERIYYTLDGSVPTLRSRVYSNPIEITETSVVRAIAVAENLHPSLPITSTYVVGEDFDLPILSIVTDPRNLWDGSIGIHANPGQRGEMWERPAAVALIEPEGEVIFDVSENIGLRIHGGASRWVDKKSFRIYWRGRTYLDYSLFPNKPEINQIRRLVVRSGGNDQATGWDGNLTWVMMRCWLMGELWRQAGGNSSAHLPVVLLLNGELWGMYNLRERIDRFYLQENFNIDPDNVDLIKYEHPGRATVQEGTIDAWNELNYFFESNEDFTDPLVYEMAKSKMDIENFIDYTIMQIYAANWDWPQNNVYAFRERSNYAKWQWILWDIDDAFMFRSPLGHNTLQWGTRDRGRRDLAPPWYVEAGADTLHTTLKLRRLLTNSEFKQLFIDRAVYLFSTVLHRDHVIKEIEKGADMMIAGVEHEVSRWGTTKEQWLYNVDRMKEYAEMRPEIVRLHFIRMFKLDELTFPEIK